MAIYARYTYLDWFQDEASETLDIFKYFISNNEEFIERNIVDFNKQKEVHVLEVDEEVVDIYETYNGFSDQLWSLTDVFTSFLPQTQRKSLLISLYSYLEYSLNQLCKLYDNNENNYVLHTLKIHKNDRRSVIEKSVDYLKKEISLPIDKSSQIWKHIEDFRRIRNIIVHNNGCLKDSSGNDHKDASKIRLIIKREMYLNGVDNIFLLNGYLIEMIDRIKSFFRHINELIQSKG